MISLRMVRDSEGVGILVMGVGLIHFLCGKSYLNDLSFMLSCMVSCYSRKAYICQGGGASFSNRGGCVVVGGEWYGDEGDGGCGV